MPTGATVAAQQQPQQTEPTCCLREPIHYWSAGTQGWMKSDMAQHPGRNAMRDETCLPTIIGDETPDVQVILARAEDVKQHAPCLTYFQTKLDMPSLWFTEYSRKSNGYFGSEILTDDNGGITGIATWCRYFTKTFTPPDDEPEKLDYHWDKLNMFTRWDHETRKTTIVLFIRPEVDLKVAFQPEKLFSGLSKKYLEDPFWMYSFALADVAEKQNDSVWKVRTAVRAKEKKTQNKDNMDYRSLHDLARHTIHGTEMLDAAVAVTESILREHEMLKEILMPHAAKRDRMANLAKATGDRDPHGKTLASHYKTHSSLTYHLSLFRTLLYRSTSNKERLLNEINLVFNTVAQLDAATSHKLAEASRLDSAAMKTIAFVTTAFLPATFIAAIFSTSFFNFEQGTGWAVSGTFWIYWVCAIPVTVASVAALHWWQKWFVERGGDEKGAKRMTRRSITGTGVGKKGSGSAEEHEEPVGSDVNGSMQLDDLERGIKADLKRSP